MAEPRTHELKTWPAYFEAIRRGDKTAELRFDDRGFAAGDILVLQEFDPEADRYTGKSEIRVVRHVTNDESRFGLAVGWVMLSFVRPDRAPAALGEPLPLDELWEHHLSEALLHRATEGRHRVSATKIFAETKTQALADRWTGCADEADKLATFHERAAAALEAIA